MRDITKSLYILILFTFFVDIYAQLPPEIMSDRYLVKAELLEESKNYVAAFEVMDKVIALHKTHDLKLPDDFHFKYARVALAADSIRIAYDSVNLYLTTAGREGEFYREALLLSLEAEEELEVPEIRAEDLCAGKERGAECWLELANHPECYVWDVNYFAGYTLTWTGSCLGRVARGEGTLVWARESDQYSEFGRLRGGKYHGRWVVRNRFGLESEGPHLDGERHGVWVVQTFSNERGKGKYSHGKRDGVWLEYFRKSSSGEETCTAAVYRQGEKVAERSVDMSNCEGW